MGIFVNKAERAGRYGWNGTYRHEGDEYLNARGKALAWLAVAPAGFGVLSNEGLGAFDWAWGHGTKLRTDASMLSEAKSKYAMALKQASPSQLFAMRYLDASHVGVSRTIGHNSGIAGSWGMSAATERQFNIADRCLNDTAFDINGGHLNFHVEYSGLFSSVSVDATGDTPTAAAVASYNPASHVLTVRSGNARPEDLHFNVEGTQLKPLDANTRNLLGTYGCKSAVQYSNEDVY